MRREAAIKWKVALCMEYISQANTTKHKSKRKLEHLQANKTNLKLLSSLFLTAVKNLKKVTSCTTITGANQNALVTDTGHTLFTHRSLIEMMVTSGVTMSKNTHKADAVCSSFGCSWQPNQKPIFGRVNQRHTPISQSYSLLRHANYTSLKIQVIPGSGTR